MSTRKFCILLLVLVQISATLSQATAFDGNTEAVLAINTAEEVTGSAYQTVKEAEMAGADISGFSQLLRDAAQLLAQARTSFRVGDFDSAVRFASLTSEIGIEVETKASRLRELKRGLPVMQVWLTIVESILGVLAVILLSFWSWRVFKRLYYRRIRTAKPEVVSDGS